MGIDFWEKVKCRLSEVVEKDEEDSKQYSQLVPGSRAHVEYRQNPAKFWIHRGDILLDEALEAYQRLCCVASGLGDDSTR